MHRTVLVAHSSFIDGSHTTKNTASAQPVQLSETCEWHKQYNFCTKKHGEIHLKNNQHFCLSVEKVARKHVDEIDASLH